MYKEETIYTDDGEKVVSKMIKYQGRFHDSKGYFLYAHGNTICSRITADFPLTMDKADIGRMTLLAKKLIPNTNVIGYRGHKGNKGMTIIQIGEVIGIQERQAYRFIKKMMGIDMIKHSNGQYIINPLYFLNGKAINDELYWLFNQSLDKQLPVWVRESYRTRKESF